MGIGEPSNSYGLWAAVRAVTGWPDTDEEGVRELSDAWGRASRSFAEAARLDTTAVRAAWPDAAGRTFADNLDQLRDRASRVEVSARQQQGYTANFAQLVSDAKIAVTNVIEFYLDAYGASLGPAPEHAAAIRETATAQVQQILADAAARIQHQDSGVAAEGVPGGGGAEYDAAVDFITGEIDTNSHTSTVADIRALAGSGDLDNWSMAMNEWIFKVRAGADWDHKSDYLRLTAGDNQVTPIPGTGYGIRYDFWSNFHFGYVGREAGLGDGLLNAGADAADLVSQEGTDGSDQLAVRLGIELQRSHPGGGITPDDVRRTIDDHFQELVDAGTIVEVGVPAK